MLHSKAEGYLFDKRIREQIGLLVFADVHMIFCSCLLWFIPFDPDTKDVWAFVCCAASFSLVVFICTIKVGENCLLYSLQYQCDEQRITLFNKKACYTLDLTKPFYLTQLSIRLPVGKGHIDRCFFVFTSVPLSQIKGDYDDFELVKQIYNNGGVLLPLDAIEWVQARTGVESAHMYPRCMYFFGLSI